MQVERLGGLLDAADEAAPLGLLCARRERGNVEPERVQRLAEIVTCRCEKLAFRAIGAFGGTTRFMRCTGALAEFRDQVDIFVAHRERLRQHVVQAMPESDDEHEHDGHHERGEQMHRIGDQRDAHYQWNQRRQNKTVERRPIHGREIETAERDAEHADNQQRIVRRRRRVRDPAGDTPQNAGQRRSDGPVAAPAKRGGGAGTDTPPCPCERTAPTLIERNQHEPADHRAGGDVIPHHDAQDDGAETHRNRRQMPARIKCGDLVGARTSDQRWSHG